MNKDDVKRVIQNCNECNSIDPHSVRIEKGQLTNDEVWNTLATDFTHHNGKLFLTIIDCCSRYSIWREGNGESSEELLRHFSQIFYEFGPPKVVLADNGKAFRSEAFQELCKEWKVKLHFRCAYKPSGNGVVERVHRTVKRTMARAGINSRDAVYWYNVAPRTGKRTSPQEELFRYGWRMLRQGEVAPNVRDVEVGYTVGEWV